MPKKAARTTPSKRGKVDEGPPRTIQERLTEFLVPEMEHVDALKCQPGANVRLVKSAGVEILVNSIREHGYNVVNTHCSLAAHAYTAYLL